MLRNKCDLFIMLNRERQLHAYGFDDIVNRQAATDLDFVYKLIVVQFACD